MFCKLFRKANNIGLEIVERSEFGNVDDLWTKFLIVKLRETRL